MQTSLCFPTGLDVKVVKCMRIATVYNLAFESVWGCTCPLAKEIGGAHDDYSLKQLREPVAERAHLTVRLLDSHDEYP